MKKRGILYMATKKTNSKTNKTISKKTNTIVNKNESPVEEVQNTIQETKLTKITARKIKADLDLNMLIPVVNGHRGKLVYNGKKSGEHIEWEDFGDEQLMELKELKDARASQRKFFENNWFLIDDPEVLEFLNAGEYYRNSINAENYDDIFFKPVQEIKETVSQMTPGQKKSMMYRAIELINSGELDSLKTIKALKELLGFEIDEG